MADFPGFPSNNFDFHFEEVGAALAGMIVRDINGVPRAGLFPSRDDLIRVRSDWFLDASPFVAVRVKGRAVLIGGTTEDSTVEVVPAPSANGRIDVVWTRPADMDAGEDTVPLHVMTGLPAAVPQKPAIPAEAIEVAVFELPAGASGTQGGTLTITFPQTVGAGGVIPFRTLADRDAFDGVIGQLGRWNGTLYRKYDGGWVQESSATNGTNSVVVPANNVLTTRVIALRSGLFRAAPSIAISHLTALGGIVGLEYRIVAITATSFTVECRKPGASVNWQFSWLAVGV